MSLKNLIENPLNQNPSRPVVHMVKGDDAYNITRQVLQPFDFSSVKGKRVLLKPNAGRLANVGSGITTHPDVVAAVIDEFNDAGAIVEVGESPISGVKALDALEATGISKIANERNCPVIDLDANRFVWQNIPDGLAIKKLKFCKQILDYDFIVSIPVMKMHMHTDVTLAIKNMKGCLWRRSKVDLHMLPKIEGYDEKPINIAIADMSGILRPHFAIVDGIIGMEGLGPSSGTAKKADIVIAGADGFSVDAVSCAVMGTDAKEVFHLAMGAERGYGVIDLDRIDVSPLDWKKWITPFKKSPDDLSFDFPDFEILDDQSCSACQSTLLLTLRRYGKQILDYFPKDSKARIAIGKGHKSLPEGTLCIGNCTIKHKKNGIYVSGCPSVTSEIVRAMSGTTFFDLKDGHSDSDFDDINPEPPDD